MKAVVNKYTAGANDRVEFVVWGAETDDEAREFIQSLFEDHPELTRDSGDWEIIWVEQDPFVHVKKDFLVTVKGDLPQDQFWGGREFTA